MIWNIGHADYNARNIHSIRQGDVPVIFSTGNYTDRLLIDEEGQRPHSRIVVTGWATWSTKDGVTTETWTSFGVYRHDGRERVQVADLRIEPPFVGSFEDALEASADLVEDAIAEALATDADAIRTNERSAFDALIEGLPERFATDAEYEAWCADRGIEVIDPRSYEARYWSDGVAQNSPEIRAAFYAVQRRAFQIMAEEREAERQALMAPPSLGGDGPECTIRGTVEQSGWEPRQGARREFFEGVYEVVSVDVFECDQDTSSLRGSAFIGTEGQTGFVAKLRRVEVAQ